MLHVIMIILIYGVDTESIKCPEQCVCIQTEVFKESNTSSTPVANEEDFSEIQNLNGYKINFENVIVNDSEYNSNYSGGGDNKTFPWKYTLTKKCSKNKKENVRDIFIHNFSTKPVNTSRNDNLEQIRSKRTVNANVNDTTNAKNISEKVDVTRKNYLIKENNLVQEFAASGSGSLVNYRNNGIFTYHITCDSVRDMKPSWVQYFPNPTAQVNIRKTYFQSFKAFFQILKESPVKLPQLTLLSISDSLINQKPSKKYSSNSESSSKEGNVEEKKDGSKEFLPFASLQNPKLRPKPDAKFPSKLKSKNLQVLQLINNTITYLPRDTFQPFQNLQVLNLSNNLLKFIDDEIFTPLSNLLQLDIHNNRLESVSDLAFKNLTKLLYLDLSQNLLKNMAPSSFQYLTSLNILNLGSNPLSEKQEAMILLGTGKRLQVVDISRTGISQIPGILERSVRVLNLMGNHLLSIRCGDLDSYSLLSYLNLRSNKISYVEDDALGRLEFLDNLQISENNLFQIPKSLPNKLEILNLSYNNIQNITNLDFLNLSLLKELFLSSNQVSNIEGNAFNNLVHLKVLDLSRNPILTLPNIYGLVKLTVLNLSYFTNIPGTFTMKYKQFPVQSPENIEQLNLESSPVLTKIFLQDTKTLEMFRNLEELDIRFSNVTTMRKDIFALLTKLKVLKVEGNPWHCRKEILVLSEWLKNHKNNKDEVVDEDEVNTAHCSTPVHLYKTALVDLTEKDFEFFPSNRKDERNATVVNEAKGKKLTKNSSDLFEGRKESLGKFFHERNVTVKTLKVEKVNLRNNNKSDGNVKPFLNCDPKGNVLGVESHCGKSGGKIEERRGNEAGGGKVLEKSSTTAMTPVDKRFVAFSLSY